MNGPSHYREAERLLVDSLAMTNEYTPVGSLAAIVGLAQVHATLALAAATALQFHLDLLSGHPDSPGSAWREVLS